MLNIIILLSCGLISGALSALLGVGGAVVIIPILALVLGYGQKLAQGTSLFVLILPLTLIPALNYYKSGYVNVKSGIIIIIGFIISSFIVSKFAVEINDYYLKKIFAVFIIIIGILMFFKK